MLHMFKCYRAAFRTRTNVWSFQIDDLRHYTFNHINLVAVLRASWRNPILPRHSYSTTEKEERIRIDKLASRIRLSLINFVEM